MIHYWETFGDDKIMADFGISYRNNNLEITLNFIEILSLGNIKINISLFNSVM